MRPGNISSDYYVYLDEDNGVVIDLFYAKDIHSLRGVLNIKKNRYQSLPYKTIFVLVGNDELGVDVIRKLVQRRKIPLPSNILVDSEANFKASTVHQIKKLSKYSRY